jgi:CMP-N-acetylneuraminate monooxygenase
MSERQETQNGTRHTILEFPLEDLDKEVTFMDGGSIIVHKDGDGNITATRNRCRHQNGRFLEQSGCVLICPNHGWSLDVSSMEYVNPLGMRKQDQLKVEIDDRGIVGISETDSPKPWEVGKKDPEILSQSEFTIRFYAHACAEIRCGSATLFTDPWLMGPAFTRGWWLTHRPPADWLDRLAAADAIYISHNHSDHLNIHTLKELAKKNPTVPVFVPQFDSDSCVRMAEQAGMKNVRALPFNIWINLGPDSRFMILQDARERDDSGILIDYRGHLILDLVDSGNLNGEVLPEQVDIMLSSFAGGASGFPVCWSDLYSEEEIRKVTQRNCDLMAEHVLRSLKVTKAKVFVPFAGYFTEAHPSDADIKSTNPKNSAQYIQEFLLRRAPGITTWIPDAGVEFDIGLLKPSQTNKTISQAPEYDFDRFLDPIRDIANFSPLQSMDGIHNYFKWAGYKGDLILHVVETDEAFDVPVREFHVDFSDLSFPEVRPNREHRYLRMRVRSDVFRYVLRWGLPWEEISIGFQARFYREPDVYNYEFWKHFQDNLPVEVLEWE